jgi:hypothetical protein
MPAPRSKVRAILWGLGAILAVVLAVPAIYICWDWTYLNRILTYPREAPVTTVAWYKPMELVRGGSGFDLPVAGLAEPSLWQSRTGSNSAARV